MLIKMSAITIQDLVGVWKRNSIRFPDGTEDTTTAVYWLQGLPHFADIRVPANRPSFDGVHSIEECNPAQRAWLKTQQGFAGTLRSKGDAWLWLRDIDYQPASGKRDIGTLAFQDAEKQFVVEIGVDEPYVEIWERVDVGKADVVLVDGGMLISVGEHFILARMTFGGVEISRGFVSDWMIRESTFPWREGESIGS
jgi:hypothetical protein